MAGAFLEAVRRALPRLALCAGLGLVTTAGVLTALAMYVPIEKAPARVALDGDHLQPWLIELKRVGAHRTIWFEKGRIYTKSQFGPRDGSGSSSAVSCWSFAISTRNDSRTTKGPITIQHEITDATQASPPTAWGGCLDERGWPLPAAQALVLGEMSPQAPRAYRIVWGAPLNMDTTRGSRNSLADIRMVPWRPVWTGLLADTVVYAGVWWCLLLVPRAIAARYRKRQGACKRCGYDMSGLPAGVCPECGTAA
jgi:hypothetical protein